MRACIGRTFAWQEALLAMAILLQRFSFRLDDPSYALHMKFSLTIKPKDLYIRATLRDGLDATSVERAMNAPPSDGSVKTKAQVPRNLQPPLDESGAQKITILYGSNTGTCETLAQKLVADCAMYGLKAEVSPLDSLTGPLPTDRSVVIITSSYEGQPPDNAIHFVEWLTSLREQELSGVRFSVFGCGHRKFSSYIPEYKLTTSR
jgi:cytochrome P450/NADPH-cytochrome P450 reductase